MMIENRNKSFASNIMRTWKDVLDDQLLSYVPEHWLSFEPPDKYQHIILGCLYIIILVPAIFGNGMIIWLSYRCRGLRTPSNILVINLAISDFIMNIKMPVFIYNSFNYGPALGEFGCQIYGFLGGLSGTSAIMSIAFMALERFNSISRPLSPFLKQSKERALIVVFGIWLYSFTFSFPPVIKLFNRYVPEGYLTSCSFDYLSKQSESRVFIVVYFIAAWVVPMIVITISYTGIVIAVKRSHTLFIDYDSKHTNNSTGHNEQLQRMNHSDKSYKKSEIRLAKIAFSLFSLWLISWTPYAIVALIGMFKSDLLTPTISMVPALFAKTSSVINPFVYGLTHPKFKREFQCRFMPWHVNKYNATTRYQSSRHALELQVTSEHQNIRDRIPCSNRMKPR